MEGIKKSGSSPSSPSLTSQLFGSRDNPSSSSSSGIFGSIFAHPSKVMGQETVTGGWNDKSSKAGGDVEKKQIRVWISLSTGTTRESSTLSSELFHLLRWP
ncbi:uncharacterized protein LOC125605117 [Brassica napus]|uniref:uncharacterized protein LOC125605117 n=1 Tax=Brassica napus TaxID=3708 RepID=UPI00207858B6|nr:uncharacterized protein LOC125605117 [Brassica napus]